MRWFKHLTAANGDESLRRMMDEFGLEGYGAYWIVLEAIAAQCDKKDESCKTSLTLSIKNWRKIVPFAPQKLTKWLAFADQLTLFCVEISENMISVSCPKLLKYRDEYSSKKGKCRDSVGTKSALDTDTDTEAELEQEKYSNTVGPEAESSEPKPMNLFAEEPTPAPEPEQEPDDPKYSGFTVFHAEGEMRISKRDFAAWQKAYSNLDLAAELQALSDWTRETREWSKKSAFMACSAALRKKNELRKPAEDTSWHKYRPWAERYLLRRAAMHPTDTPAATADEIDAGAKSVAGWIGPDGYTEQLLLDTVAWLLQSAARCQSVLSLAHLGDPVPKWGHVVTWASNGARGVAVPENPQEAAA